METRREFLLRSVCLAGAAATAKLSAALPTAHKLNSIGIRVFNVRPENAEVSYRDLVKIGYTEMEEAYNNVEACWPVIQASSLKKVNVYVDGVLTAPGKEDELSRQFDQIKKWGFPSASCSYRDPAPGEGPQYAAEKYRIFAERMNKAGERAVSAGLGPLLYHNQIFEFRPENGTTGYQLLLDTQDQKVCGLELDVYWISLAGHDPAEYLKKLAGRVKILHMKDKPAGLPVMYEHAKGPGNFIDVGEGSLDWPGIFRTATSTGVIHFMVEPDAKSAADMVEHARKSYSFLSKVEF
jgi:sugar phosphate isomerase/epimerase